MKSIDKLYNKLKSTDAILIGLGKNLYSRSLLPDNYCEWSVIKSYIKRVNKHLNVNKKIMNMISNKDYFIVTSSWSSYTSESSFKNNVLTPSGNYNKLQCYNGCTNKTFDIKNYLDLRVHPKCPECGEKLVLNINTDAYFIQDEYKEQEKLFHNWLHKNYEKNILILEWEIDENYELDLKEIRESFENIAIALPNASFIRVNSKKSTIPEILINKAEGIKLKITPNKFIQSC